MQDVIATGGTKSGITADGIDVNDGATGRTIRATISNTLARYLGASAVGVSGANTFVSLQRSSLMPLGPQKQTGLTVSGGASASMVDSQLGDNFATTGVVVGGRRIVGRAAAQHRARAGARPLRHHR